MNQGPLSQVQDPKTLEVIARRRPQRLEVEIGCGNGHFLAAYSAQNPQVFLVGIDTKKARCEKALSKLQKAGCANCAIIYGRAEACLAALPDQSVDKFHIYFPDPWPKTKHRKRRFIRQENARLLENKLKEGGSIYFSTDIFDYYLQAKVIFLLGDRMRFAAAAPLSAMYLSVFGARSADWGKSINFLCAVKES